MILSDVALPDTTGENDVGDADISNKDFELGSDVTKWELPNLFEKEVRNLAVTAGKQASAPSTSEFEQGREAGFDAGKQEGLEAAKAETSEKISALDGLVTSLTTPLAQVDSQIARELIQLSVRLAETIIHREVDAQPELVERQVAEALATLTSKSSEICIRLHPEDAKILKASREEASAQEDLSEGQYRIVPDTGLHRGGCILETPNTLVDATIEKQLQDLLKMMLEKAADQ